MHKDYAKQTNMEFEDLHTTPNKSRKFVLILGVTLMVVTAAACLYLFVDFNAIEKKAIKTLTLKPKPFKPKATFEFYQRLPTEDSTPTKISVTKPSKPNIKPLNTVSKATTDTVTTTINNKRHHDKTPFTKPQKLVLKTPNYNKTIENTSTNTKRFQLQVGSFQNYHDADKLKAELLLDGFNCYIERFRKENITWYRVQVGPYQSLNQAKKTQLALEKDRRECFIKQIG